MKPSGPKPLDIARIAPLRAKGLTWREVGAALAREDGRAVAYQPTYLQALAVGRRPRKSDA